MNTDVKKLLSIPEETRITLRIPASIKEKLLANALKENRSMNNMILTALSRYFDSHPD